MNAACLKCNLKTLNQYERFSKGEYVNQFNISPHSQNMNFVRNPYHPQKCHVSDIVCFSLTQGAIPCSPDQTLLMAYSASGKLHRVPLKL